VQRTSASKQNIMNHCKLQCLASTSTEYLHIDAPYLSAAHAGQYVRVSSVSSTMSDTPIYHMTDAVLWPIYPRLPCLGHKHSRAPGHHRMTGYRCATLHVACQRTCFIASKLNLNLQV
jgi:hypothetical protein